MYDTEVFRNLAEQWKQLDAEGLIAYEMHEPSLLRSGYMGMHEGEGNYVYLGMPTLNGETVTPIQVEAFYVNRYGEHAEAAEEFMEIFTSLEVQNYTFGAAALFTTNIEASPYYAMWEAMEMMPTEESMQQWQDFLKTGRQSNVIMGWTYGWSDIIGDFTADKLTLDEFVAEIQERADLMVGE